MKLTILPALAGIVSVSAFAPSMPRDIPSSMSARNNKDGSTSSSLAMKLTLYGSQGSRSPLVNWGAYEIGESITMGDLSQNPHPFGQIPCLTDDNGVRVFESGAILQYIYSNSMEESVTGDSASRKAAIASWISWANASLDPICFLETPEGKVYDTGLKKPNRRIDVLDQILSNQDYLLPDGFSTADVAVASYLLYVPQFFGSIDLSRWPNVVRYMKRCAERPKYAEAFGAGVQQSLVGALDGMMGDGEGGGKKKNMFGF